MVGIAEMFAEYDGSDRDDFQMAFWFEREYQAKLERNRDYRRRNKLYARLRNRRQRAENGEQVRAYFREYQRKWRAEHAEQAKAYQREQKRKWRARKRAERKAA